MSDPIQTALDGYVEAWNADDRDGFLALFAEGATLEDPVGSPVVEGREALGVFWDRVHSMGMEYEAEVSRVVRCGLEGALVFTMTSRAPGVSMTVKLVDIFTINEAGKIVSMRAFWDQSCMSMG